ncbi:hypothetical protein GCM10010168_29860 [Actinoplanes ianthinogenes]|uniref:FXSXX-COOH protein n=1 Tax=Actinoplanes ianthinogenes TaxID=122358 RepID=A0ABM7LLJ1_9ACTN|nr:hypothetical protein Aiant_07850 [Actinoplanes ianthinogenes]GGR10450.1 hypothetical protein GCM10010168_29860 [Actinoplanes ianthinogenes]
MRLSDRTFPVRPADRILSVGPATLPSMPADLTFEHLASVIRGGDVKSVATALTAVDEPVRRALAAPLRDFRAT